MTTAPTNRVSVWAQALRLIPALAWVLCIVLLLIYKPDGYKEIVWSLAAATAFVVVIAFFAIRKARTRKQTNA
jgi:hypothetical protein